jgi:hypothetical protein
MKLTEEQLKANEDFFDKVASLTNLYVWKEYLYVYKIEDGMYICSCEDSYNKMIEHTTPSFHKRIIKNVSTDNTTI